MRKVIEMLRLRAAGVSVRDIAASVGTGKTTVYDHLSRAQAAGIGWPLPEGMDEETLDALLFPPPSAELAAARPVPDWRQVHREIKRGRHVTLRLVWLEWREDHPDGWAYSQFCYHYNRWLGVQDVVMRLSYAAGERMFVDFAGDKAAYVEPDIGERVDCEVFVAVLGCSGLLYVEATRSQDLGSWLGAHEHAWQAYGGVAELTVPDNLRAGVNRACRYDPEVNIAYAELAEHFGTVVLPARAAHPRDKAAVEAGVQVAERWVLAPLRHRQFFSLSELNAAIAEKVAEVNARPFRGQPTSRQELFDELEKAALRPLPAGRWELASWKKVTVNIDYHVEFDRRYYSVPFQLARQRLDLRATAGTVEVFKGGNRVASHAREHGRKRYITDPAHMPASHRAHLEWTPTRLIGWAGTISPATATLVERILDARPHPEQGYRACLGLMRLAKRYGEQRLADAATRALAVGTISYTSVKSILAEGLDRQPLPEPDQPAPPPPLHQHLRGAGYWADAPDTAEEVA